MAGWTEGSDCHKPGSLPVLAQSCEIVCAVFGASMTDILGSSSTVLDRPGPQVDRTRPPSPPGDYLIPSSLFNKTFLNLLCS